MDETPGFDSSNLQILVLDEADRILDMVTHHRACLSFSNVCSSGLPLQLLCHFLFGKAAALLVSDSIILQGFSATLNAIIENLPVERQTLLFSATQTKSVSYPHSLCERKRMQWLAH